MSSRIRSVPHLGPQPGANKDAIAKHVPPYAVQRANINKRYKTLTTFDSFGRAFLAYAHTMVMPGEKARLINGKGKVIVHKIG